MKTLSKAKLLLSLNLHMLFDFSAELWDVFTVFHECEADQHGDNQWKTVNYSQYLLTKLINLIISERSFKTFGYFFLYMFHYFCEENKLINQSVISKFSLTHNKSAFSYDMLLFFKFGILRFQLQDPI